MYILHGTEPKWLVGVCPGALLVKGTPGVSTACMPHRLVLRLWASAFSAFWPQHAGDCFVHFVEIQGIYIYLLETSGVVHLCGPALAQVGLWDGRLCEKRFPQVVPAAGFLCNFTVDIRVLACLHLPTVGSWGNLTPNLSGSIWWVAVPFLRGTLVPGFYKKYAKPSVLNIAVWYVFWPMCNVL